MSIPESEHQFNGIIMMSYSADEYSRLVDWSDECFSLLERQSEFRRGPGIMGDKNREYRQEWLDSDWEDPL